MARFIQLPSRKAINLDAVLWIDHPNHRSMKIVFYGHGELIVKDEEDKRMLIAALNLQHTETLEDMVPTRRGGFEDLAEL